ncbi:MAG: proline dehydrogenase [Acidobacteria bacterium]|nr:proline dehydrogenase [Acidobacteriota bacterium]
MNPIRAALLAMAGSPTWKKLLTGWGATHRVVARFVPGETLDEALEAVRALNARGLKATLNPLGENVSTEAEAETATEAYCEILERIEADHLDCNISVKLTVMGLDLGEDVAARNLSHVLQTAAMYNNFVRIDMEASEYVGRTIDLWRQARREYPAVGTVIQSYLRRSAADVDTLAAEGAPLRIVKGAYAEPEDVAFPDKNDVDAEYVRLLERLAESDALAAGSAVAVATHDPAMVAAGRRLIDDNDLVSWEFQMLYGIGANLQQELARDGYRVRVYVSYGPSWYPWFMRRLAERPANIGFFLRHLFG